METTGKYILVSESDYDNNDYYLIETSTIPQEDYKEIVRYPEYAKNWYGNEKSTSKDRTNLVNVKTTIRKYEKSIVEFSDISGKFIEFSVELVRNQW